MPTQVTRYSIEWIFLKFLGKVILVFVVSNNNNPSSEVRQKISILRAGKVLSKKKILATFYL